MKKRRLALVVAAVFTAVAALWSLASLALIAASFYYRPTVETSGSGGIGAVSLGIAEPLVEMLPLLAAALFVNISVASQARQRGRGAVRIRRAHLLITVVTFVALPIAVLPFSMLMSWISAGPDVASDWTMISVLMIVLLCGAGLAAIHAAFGVFAIGLLRRQP